MAPEPESATSASDNPVDLATTMDNKTSRDDAIPIEPDSSQPKQSKIQILLVLVSILLAMFLVCLDRTIISTAVPQITDEFNAITDVGWYGSAYLLTSCALQLLFGKIYTFFPVKNVLLSSILLFEAASALCGAAPNSLSFIIGRAISGVGAAGIFTGAIVCMVYVVPLEKRSIMQGMFGAVMGVASVAGPLIGGSFTTYVTWRWCFYINLPIGGAVMVIIFFILNVTGNGKSNVTFTEKLKQLDILGTILLIPGVVCLLLALQWGGQTYAWQNWRIILLLTLAGVLLIAFAVVQAALPNTATLPPRLFKQRSLVAAFWSIFLIMCGNYIVVYFLPIYFQSIKGASAAESGIWTLPLMLSMVFASIIGGIATSKVGYYTPFAIVGSCIMTVGAGLLTTLHVDTSEGKWIGYQVVYGFGLGLCMQVPALAAQASLPKKDVPMGTGLVLFGTLLGAAMYVSVGESVMVNGLASRLSGIPGIDPALLGSGGATSLISSLPVSLQGTVTKKYNEALQVVFLAGLIPCCLAVPATALLEWNSVKKKQAKTVGSEPGAWGEKKPEKEIDGPRPG